MLKIISSVEHKRAFKKALKELDESRKVERQTKKSSSDVSQVYSRDNQRMNSAFAKPSTEVIDLKEFKNWRKVEKVESKNPIYAEQLFKSSLSKSDDNAFEEKVKKEPARVSQFIDDGKREDRTPSSDFSTYFAEKRKNETSVAPKKEETDDEKFANAKSTFAKMFEEVEKKKKLAEQYRQKEKTEKQEEPVQKEEQEIVLQKSEPAEEKLPEVKVEIEEEEKPKLKILPKEEVQVVKAVVEKPSTPVSAETKPAVSTVKKQTNRKPRGKNKRKFDADVVGSVDWR